VPETVSGVAVTDRDTDQAPVSDTAHIYELIWTIPPVYGGMTTVMLTRCQEFVEYGLGQSLTILTLSAAVNPPRVERHIQERWGLPDRVRVRNVWHELSRMTDNERRKLAGREPINEGHYEELDGLTSLGKFSRGIRDNKGEVVRRERLTVDGDVVVVERDVSGPKRAVVLYDSFGQPLSTWYDTSGLFLAWIDYAMTHRPAVLINEHRHIGSYLVDAQFESTHIVQVVHGSHLVQTQEGPYGRLTQSRAATIKNLGAFDLVAVLTDRQRRDIAALGVDTSNVRVLPNSTLPATTTVGDDDRPVGRGAVVGHLRPGKRTDHAIRAVTELGSSVSEHDVSLDVMGQGPSRPELESLLDTLPGSDHISLLGNVDNASEKLNKYSFLLLTSKSEGMSLVIIEAMAQGCVPISYDIRYGPTDIIDDGVNGFLSPSGDIDALADTIRKFIELPREEQMRLRHNAQKTAETYTPAANMGRWKSALNGITKSAVSEKGFSAAARGYVARVSIDGTTCRVEGHLIGDHEDLRQDVKLLVVTRDGMRFLGVAPNWDAVKNSDGMSRASFTAEFQLGHIAHAIDAILDFYLQPAGALWQNKIRLKKQKPGKFRFKRSGDEFITKYGNVSLEVKK